LSEFVARFNAVFDTLVAKFDYVYGVFI